MDVSQRLLAVAGRLCKEGMAVGVIGVGGLGHIAIQFAKAMGCTVTAISTGESKREQAAEFGASRCENTR